MGEAWEYTKTWPLTWKSVHDGSVGKAAACRGGHTGDVGSIPGSGGPLEEEMAVHSRILAWRSPWTEQPGGLQSKGSQRVGQD